MDKTVEMLTEFGVIQDTSFKGEVQDRWQGVLVLQGGRAGCVEAFKGNLSKMFIFRKKTLQE